MSDMTDPGFLRRCANETPIPGDAVRFRLLADRLDAMQWREKPPDLNGDWIRRRDKRVDTTFPFKRCFGQTFIADYHQPGDLWFKIPEDPK